jgi:hypothetical protein
MGYKQLSSFSEERQILFRKSIITSLLLGKATNAHTKGFGLISHSIKSDFMFLFIDEFLSQYSDENLIHLGEIFESIFNSLNNDKLNEIIEKYLVLFFETILKLLPTNSFLRVLSIIIGCLKTAESVNIILEFSNFMEFLEETSVKNERASQLLNEIKDEITE